MTDLIRDRRAPQHPRSVDHETPLTWKSMRDANARLRQGTARSSVQAQRDQAVERGIRAARSAKRNGQQMNTVADYLAAAEAGTYDRMRLDRQRLGADY